jgi:hypothetical protein
MIQKTPFFSISHFSFPNYRINQIIEQEPLFPEQPYRSGA